MSDIDQFEKKIRFYASKAGELGDAAVIAASSISLQKLAETTPVDTGLAVSNWQVGLGSSPPNEIAAFAPGEKGSTAVINRTMMLESGLSRLKGYKSGEGRAVYIVNNAKHIGALNDGHSKQAPKNFVEAAVQAARAGVRNLRISLK